MSKRSLAFVVNQQWLTIKSALTTLGVNIDEELEGLKLGYPLEDPNAPITVPILTTFLDLLIPRLSLAQFHQLCAISAKSNVSDALDMTNFSNCKTVAEALDRYCSDVSLIMTDSSLSLENFVGETWLKSFRPYNTGPSYKFAEAYGMIFFTELVAQLSGIQWKANKLGLAGSNSDHIDLTKFIASPVIYTQRDFFGIGVEPEILSLPLTPRSTTNTASVFEHIGNDFELALRYVVLSLLGDNIVTLEQISRSTHLSTRTIQRRLQDLGKNYQQFYEDLIISEAKRRLYETNRRVTEIGYQLGYSSSASFIRFFKQKVGITPKQFQLQCTKRDKSLISDGVNC